MHRSRPSTVLRSTLLLVALTAAVASCRGGSSSADTALAPTAVTGRPPTAATTATTTTEPPTTTIATVVLETTTTVPPTTNAVGDASREHPAVPVYPLTGVTNPDPVVAGKPALIVKIDNAPGARPQSGFNEADIVFEEIVNDNLTRFALVFQSGDARSVGPIRSGRIQDINIFTSLDHPLFAWSGGNKTVTDAIDASELINIGPAKAAVYHRTTDKQAPHNLYSSTDALYSRTVLYQPAAKQQFQYRADGAAPAGTPSPGAAVSLDSIDVRWDWDAAAGLYRRTMEAKPHSDALSGQVTTNNVVIFDMEYLPGISDSPDAQVVGTGEVFVLTGGDYVHGTWTKNDIHEAFTLTADDGTPILLQPGRTFVELPRAGHTIILPAG